MADGVAITAGSGTTILTDDTGAGGHAQVMKLAISTDGSGTLIPADGTYGLAVDVKRIGKPLVKSSVASGGLSTGAAYTAGDQVGTEFTMTNCARTSGGSGYITGCVLYDKADVIGPYDVVIFDSATTPASDNAAATWTDTDVAKIVAIIPLSGSYDTGANRVAQAYNLYIPFVCDGGTSLYANLICRVGHGQFGATSDLQLILYVEQN